MKSLLELPPRDRAGNFHAIVESPRGARVKLKYDPALATFTISRPLNLGLAYPFDWGFVPSTRGPDGDPLDVMILHDASTFPGVAFACRALGAIQVTQSSERRQGRERNDRVIAVPVKAPRSDGVVDARQLTERTRRELEQFFLAVSELTPKEPEVIGWAGPDDAERLIEEAIAAFAKK
ncbi:MAG TPA: inorganic diphosphatase [Polyangia bacterium]|nr:inorganic diphosphatase [Polyangia bacterium]